MTTAEEDALALGPLPGYLGFKLRQAQAASFRHLDRTAGGKALSPGQFSLLTVIEANPGVTQTRIARAFGRAYGLSLTAAGRRKLEAKRAQIEAQERLMAATMPVQDRARMMALLDRLVTALDGD